MPTWRPLASVGFAGVGWFAVESFSEEASTTGGVPTVFGGPTTEGNVVSTSRLVAVGDGEGEGVAVGSRRSTELHPIQTAEVAINSSRT